MDERTLQRKVHAMLQARGLVWHHCRRADHCSGTSGFPDLVVFGDGLLMFRELKGDSTPLRTHQLEFSSAVAWAGASWGVWRPGDLTSGRIVEEMDRL